MMNYFAPLLIGLWHSLLCLYHHVTTFSVWSLLCHIVFLFLLTFFVSTPTPDFCHYSFINWYKRWLIARILAWRILWTEKPGRLQSMGSWVEHNLVTKPPPPLWGSQLPAFRFFLDFLLVAYFNKLLPSVTWFQFSSVTHSCPTLCDPINHSMPGLPVHHQLPEFTQTHVHQVSDAIQPSHPLSSPSPPAPNPSQHQDLFQWVNSSHEVAKVLEFQLQHQSFQWTPRTDLL